MRALITLALAFLTTAAAAQPPTIQPARAVLPGQANDSIGVMDASDAAAGRYYLVVDVDGQGRLVRWQFIDEVIKFTGGQPDEPDEPDQPRPRPEPELTKIARDTRAAAKKVTGDPNPEKTALMLSKLYRMVGNEMKQKTIDPDSGEPRTGILYQLPLRFQLMALNRGSNRALKERDEESGADVSEAWQPWRETIEGLITEQIAGNDWGPDVPDEIGAGLFAAAGSPTQARAAEFLDFDFDDLAEWIDAVMRIIDFVRSFFEADQLEQNALEQLEQNPMEGGAT